MNRIELVDLFVRTLHRERGGTLRRWRIVVGEARVYDRATHPHCNWAINPQGSSAENAAVEALSDRLRSSHSIVTG